MEGGLLERVDLASTTMAQQHQELRRAASALVLRLLAAPLVLDASATVRSDRLFNSAAPSTSSSMRANRDCVPDLDELCGCGRLKQGE